MTRTNIILSIALLAQCLLIGARFASPDGAATVRQGLLLEGFERGAVERIEIHDTGEDAPAVTLVKRGEGFVVEQRSGYPADASKVDEALRDLAGLTIASTVSTTDLHHRDLEVADAHFKRRVRLVGPGQEIDLHIGKGGPGGSVHVRRAGEDAVVTVRDYSPWRLAADPASWVEREYFELDGERVVSLSVEGEHGAFELARLDAERWQLRDGGGSRPADAEAVGKLIDAVDQISLSDVEGPRQSVALETPKVTLTVGLGDVPDVPDDAAAPAGEPTPAGAETAPAVVPTPLPAQSTRTLRLAGIDGEADQLLMHADDAQFVVRVRKWAVQKLLDAKPDALSGS